MLARNPKVLKVRRQTAARVKRCEERKKKGLGSWRVNDLSIVDMEVFLEEHGLLPCGIEHSKAEVEKALSKYLRLAITPQA